MKFPFFRPKYPLTVIIRGLKEIDLWVMIVDLKTVGRLIDETAWQKDKAVAIRYVTQKGEIKEMVVSKAKKPGHHRKTDIPGIKQKYVSTNVKEKALVKVSDHTDSGRYKSLFLFGIIGFNPDGNLGDWSTIKRGS